MARRTRRFATALVATFPKFGRDMQTFSNGDFDASIPSPRRSKARALVCQARGGDVWVRLGPPRTFYFVDSPRELVDVVAALLRDEAHVVVLSKQRQWSGTTLVSRGARPAQDVDIDWRDEAWERLCEARAIVLTPRDRSPEELEVWMKHVASARESGKSVAEVLPAIHSELHERGFVEEGWWDTLLKDLNARRPDA